MPGRRPLAFVTVGAGFSTSVIDSAILRNKKKRYRKANFFNILAIVANPHRPLIIVKYIIN